MQAGERKQNADRNDQRLHENPAAMDFGHRLQSPSYAFGSATDWQIVRQVPEIAPRVMASLGSRRCGISTVVGGGVVVEVGWRSGRTKNLLDIFLYGYVLFGYGKSEHDF